MPHLKGLGSGDYEPRGLMYGGTLDIFQAFLKSENLLYKWGIISFPMASTVVLVAYFLNTHLGTYWFVCLPMMYLRLVRCQPSQSGRIFRKEVSWPWYFSILFETQHVISRNVD